MTRRYRIVATFDQYDVSWEQEHAAELTDLDVEIAQGVPLTTAEFIEVAQRGRCDHDRCPRADHRCPARPAPQSEGDRAALGRPGRHRPRRGHTAQRRRHPLPDVLHGGSRRPRDRHDLRAQSPDRPLRSRPARRHLGPGALFHGQAAQRRPDQGAAQPDARPDRLRPDRERGRPTDAAVSWPGHRDRSVRRSGSSPKLEVCISSIKRRSWPRPTSSRFIAR